MARDHKCGVYLITQRDTDLYYIGSSVNIASRWYSHRRLLNLGKHGNPRLQLAWTTYGSGAFEFTVLEECGREQLLVLEQEYLTAFRPPFNIAEKVGQGPGRDQWSEASKENFRQMRKAMAAAITHCPKGHVYDEANTYRSKAGKRICRACSAIRVSAVYGAEAPEQREVRRQRVADYYALTKDQQAEPRRAYTASHKEEKRAYDQSRAEQKREADHNRRTVANLTPEQLEAQRQARRDHYHRDPERTKRLAHDHYIRRRDRLKGATA